MSASYLDEDRSPTARAKKLYGSGGELARGGKYTDRAAEEVLCRARCRMDAKAHARDRAFWSIELLAAIKRLLDQCEYKSELHSDRWILTVKHGDNQVSLGLAEDVLSVWIGTSEKRRALPIEYDPTVGLFVGTEVDEYASLQHGRRVRRDALAVVADEIVFALDPASKSPDIGQRRYPI
jgi:hypothetical protein